MIAPGFDKGGPSCLAGAGQMGRSSMSRGAAPRHGESFRNADADEAEPAGRQTLLQFTDCGVQVYRRRRHGPQGSAWMPLATDRHDARRPGHRTDRQPADHNIDQPANARRAGVGRISQVCGRAQAGASAGASAGARPANSAATAVQVRAAASAHWPRLRSCRRSSLRWQCNWTWHPRRGRRTSPRPPCSRHRACRRRRPCGHRRFPCPASHPPGP